MAAAGAGTGAKASSAGGTWPAEIVHVNEDGWVLINRGSRHGVLPGLRLLVVGDEARELRNTATDGDLSTLLRIRRTYELLDVVYAEERCAVAIAARVPRERRPQAYRAPGGELLVWVPLPPTYTWPTPPASVSVSEEAADEQEPDDGAQDEDTVGEPETVEIEDAESIAAAQEDDRWEQALPLNGLHVGDLVLPAIPAPVPTTTDASAEQGSAEHQDTLYDAGRDYDWLDKPSS